jgi:hypothetical protein
VREKAAIPILSHKRGKEERAPTLTLSREPGSEFVQGNRDALGSVGLTPEMVMSLQRLAGNAAISELISATCPPTVQRQPAAAEAADPAQTEWDAHKKIHSHFEKADIDGYRDIRPLYVAAGIENPAKWLDETVANNEVSFFSHKTPGHPDLQPPLTAAEGKLKSKPDINSFWSFVPRRIRGSTKISNHALGRAIDINPKTNPRIIDKTMASVVKAVTGVDMLKSQDEDSMRKASEDFKSKFDDSFISTQLDELKTMRQKLVDLQASKTPKKKAIKKLKNQIKKVEGLVGVLRTWASKGFFDLPHTLVEALKSSGLQWGGDYKSSKDFMHFELGPMAAGGGAAASPKAAPAPAPATTSTPAAKTTATASKAQPPPVKAAAPAPTQTPAAAPNKAGGVVDESVATAQGAVHRLTVDGVTKGFQGLKKKKREGEPTPGEAVVLVPRSVAGASQVEVLVHLHGHGIGFRKQTAALLKTVRQAGTKVGESRDIAIDKTEAQIAASGRPMIGVLPQGGTHSEFGDNFDAKAYAEDVFKQLKDQKYWAKAPEISGVVLSGHSGAGETFRQMMGGEAHRPEFLREVIMFDSINGSGELTAIAGWLERQLDADLAGLKAAPSAKERSDYLATSFRFRGYYSHPPGAHTDWKNRKTKKGYWPYLDLYPQLETRLEKWFNKHDGELQRLGVAGQLKQNYLPLIDAGPVGHEQIMGQKNRFVEALGALGPAAPIPPASAKVAAAAPAPAHAVAPTTTPAVPSAAVKPAVAPTVPVKAGAQPAAAPKAKTPPIPKWTGTVEQKAFLERVLQAHIDKSTKHAKSVLPDLSGDELGDVAGTNLKMKKEAAGPAGELITAANAALKSAQDAGDEDAKLTKWIGATSGYRGRDKQESLWRGYFPGFYNDTRKARAKIKGGEIGDAAVTWMRDYISPKVASPGFSNHQAGIAIDLWQERAKGHDIHNNTSQEQIEKWKASWFWAWLNQNAADHEFGPYKKEPWHWEYGSGGR